MPDRCASQVVTEAPIRWTSSANMQRVESEEFLVDTIRPSSPDGRLVDNLVPLSRHALKYGELVVSAGNVVDAEVDAVVNSADESCLGGGGQDGAIARAGGALLAEKRQALPIIYGSGDKRCETGDAVVTAGGPFGFLVCGVVIHAVAPNYREMGDESECDALLRDAYRASMRRAKGQKCKTVAFTLLSAGVGRGKQPLDNVLKVAVQAVSEATYPGLQRVHLVAFRKTEQEVLQRVAKLLLATTRAVDVSRPPRATEDGDEHLAHQFASVDKALHNPSSSSPPSGGHAPSRLPPQRQLSRVVLANRVVVLQSEPLNNSTLYLRDKEVPLGAPGELDLEGEANKLRQALREAAACANVDVELQVRTATVDAFQSAVTLGARVVHFAGHGKEGFMVFEDGHGGAHALEPKALRNCVSACAAGTCKLVVLNSCKSEDVGRAFVAAGVEHVVAVAQDQNNGRISDGAGIEFCRAFYRSLANMDTVQTAFDVGRAAAQNTRKNMASDGRFILLPEDKPHDEPIFSPIPGSFRETTPLVPSNAPPPPTFYVGRDSELLVCVESILNHRLTTIGGWYGSGKSALAAKAAAHVSQHQHFNAIVWVKVTTRDCFFDDVAEAAALVIERCADRRSMRAVLERRRDKYSDSMESTRAKLRPSIDDDDKQGSDEFEQSQDARRRWSLNRDYSSLDTHRLDTSALADLAHAGPTLVVLNDFEQLVVTASDEERAREHCRLLIRALLDSCSNIKVLMTCSSDEGIGLVDGVTEQPVILGPMTQRHTAFLLLQRGTELKRRATNPNLLFYPRIAPPHVVTACASHPFIKHLNGLPVAVSLAVAILNRLFAAERAEKEACEATGACTTSPPSSKLEPLDRALRVLEAAELKDPKLRRLRDELNHVVQFGRGYRSEPEPEPEFPEPSTPASPGDSARSWSGSTSPSASASPSTSASPCDCCLSWFGSKSAGAGSTGLSGPPGLEDWLEKLAALHERGALTDAEFAKAKANLLGL